jgi:hypothetical protein
VFLAAALLVSLGGLYHACSVSHRCAPDRGDAFAWRLTAAPLRSTPPVPDETFAGVTAAPADAGQLDLEDVDGDDLIDGPALHSGGLPLQRRAPAITAAEFPLGGTASPRAPLVLGGPGAPRAPPARWCA